MDFDWPARSSCEVRQYPRVLCATMQQEAFHLRSSCKDSATYGKPNPSSDVKRKELRHIRLTLCMAICRSHDDPSQLLRFVTVFVKRSIFDPVFDPIEYLETLSHG